MKKWIKFTLLVIVLLSIPAFLFKDSIRDWYSDGKELAKAARNHIYYRLDIPLIGTPDLEKLEERLTQKKVSLGSPVFMRIFKKESILELWVKKNDKFILFSKYPICYWSGFLGPKLKRGDHQAPEGFYTVSRSQLNPNSRFHLSFNLGYPNLYDKSHKRTGDYLMVHGNCVSSGCYAMTDPVITELWTFITAAFRNGQKRFHVHAYPFRMTEINMLLHSNNQWSPFWKQLKAGHDMFEKNRIPPKIHVCGKQYQAAHHGNNELGNSKLSKKCVNTSVSQL